MSAEPPLSHAALLRVLGSDYGLELDMVTFLPGGTAPAYRAEGPSGHFFVKVLPETAYGAEVKERISAEVPLLRALRESGVLPLVPSPLPTRSGNDLSRVEDYSLVVHEWIEASNLGADWTAALGELAPLLGRLHAGTEAIKAAVQRLPVPPEDFGLPFQEGLRRDLKLLRGSLPDARAGVRALRDLLLPYENVLQLLLERAQSFQAAARSRPHSLVVCHTDAHGGNVMRDAAGALWIIDWETARLAPPEHDLWMLHARLPEVLPAYEAAAGRSADLDPDVLGFYFCRRALEDLALDVNMILHQNTRPEQDEANLTVLERYVLPSVAQTEEELARLLTALEGR
ncbi:aminoglycoside phosphotransferase family protein [Deinococcus apachensis]|uniref:aminoglycoside phosphotransferase family protein n=1 Tax=Deinococcus apachensis TaxID=309886 RepID=UPI00036BCFDC|nr:aminoglycoside phosphotransferase family protein [Deinococcus apachensis]